MGKPVLFIAKTAGGRVRDNNSTSPTVSSISI